MGWMVHQHPDGFVYVRRDGKTLYGDTTENFLDDFKIDLPALPDGADERIYEPGRRHAIQNGDTIVEGGPLQWLVGDTITANLNKGVAAFKARQAPLPPATQEELLAMSQEARDKILEPWKAATAEWQNKEKARMERIRAKK